MKRFYKIVVVFSLLFTLGMVAAYQVINTCLESDEQSNQDEFVVLKHVQHTLHNSAIDAKSILSFLNN